MPVWDGLFRPREQQQPGWCSPETPNLLETTPPIYAAMQPEAAPATAASSNSSFVQQHWHGALQQHQQQQRLAEQGSDSSPTYHASSSAPNLAAGTAAAAAAAAAQGCGSQPVRIPEGKVLAYSRLRAPSASSASPSPIRQTLSQNDSPGPESILASTAPGFSSNGIVVQGQINPVPRSLRASGSTGYLQQQSGGSNSEMPGPSNATPKRPPLPPSPRSRLLQPQQQGLYVSSQNLQLPQNPSSTAAALNPGSSSSSGPQQDRVLSSAVSGAATSSVRSRAYHQQLISNALQASSASPVAEGLLSSSLSPAAAAAAATVGEAVAAVAGNPPPPQPSANHAAAAAAPAASAAAAAGHAAATVTAFIQIRALPIRGGGALAAAAAGAGASPSGYWSGVLGAQSPQSPRVLSRRSSSYNRLSELGTSPGLIEASFMGLAARPGARLHTSSSYTNSSTTLQQLQQQQQHAMLRQQQEQHRALHGNKSPASFSEWDRVLDRESSRGFSMADSSTGGSTVGQCGSGSASCAGSTNVLPDQQYNCTAVDGAIVLPGHQGGMRAMPGSTGIHWVSRAEAGETAARGLLGLPRPGFRGDQRGIVRSGSSRDFLGIGSSTEEIQSSEQQQQGALPLPPPQQQQAAAGFIGFTGNGSSDTASQSHLAAAAAVQATPAKIGQGFGTLEDGSSSSDAMTMNPAAWIADSSNQPPSSASSRRAAAALTAAASALPAVSSSAAAAAAACGGITGDSSSIPVTPRSAAEAAVGGSFSSASTPRAAAVEAAGSMTISSPFYRRSRSGGLGLGRCGSGLLRSPSSVGYPTCLICLDQLTPDDFESGEAMQLDCRCKGEVALRHRSCAEKWSRIKGNTICDVCKAPILNLPDVPPLPPPPAQGLTDNGVLGQGGDHGLWSVDEPPALADYMFDCIRVSWVVLIVCILFFELSVSRSFLTGVLLGSAYVAMAASWAAAQRRRRQQGVAAAAAMWVAGQMPLNQQHQEQRLPLLQGQVGGMEGLPV